MRRLAFAVVFVGCLVACAWFVAQPSIEPAEASVVPAASPAQAAAPAAPVQQLASIAPVAAPHAPAPATMTWQPVADQQQPLDIKPEAVAREDQLAGDLRNAVRRSDGQCPGSAEAMNEITRAMAGWDVATASLALRRVSLENQTCAGVADALNRARSAARQSAGFSTRAAAGFSSREAQSSDPDGGVPGGDGGPGYQS